MKKRSTTAPSHRSVIWVTGASRGIGREIAAAFASLGCDVALSSREGKALRKAVKSIRELGGRAYSFPCDVKDERGVFRVAQAIASALGPVDVLVNNAGITAFKPFLKTPVGEFRDIIATNLLGPVLCTKAVLPSMVKRKRGGWIFNILSNAALRTFEDSTAYTAAKAGLLALGKVLREELRGDSIRVVGVLPGPVETAMWSRRERLKFSSRMMKPRSVAKAVLAVYRMPEDTVVDQIVLRPMKGDID